MSGFDPLYIANEGKMILVCDNSVELEVLSILKKEVMGQDAVCIGSVTDLKPGIVQMETSTGGSRIVDMLSGEMLPRIC